MPDPEQSRPRRRRRAVGPAGARPTEPPDAGVLELGERGVLERGVLERGVLEPPVAAPPDDDERLRREVPPHHGS